MIAYANHGGQYAPHPVPARVKYEFEPATHDRIFARVMFDPVKPPKPGVGRVITLDDMDDPDEPELALDRTAAAIAHSASCDASRIKRYRAAMLGKEPQTAKDIGACITINKRTKQAPLTGDGARSSLLRLVKSGHVCRFKIGVCVLYQWIGA